VTGVWRDAAAVTLENCRRINLSDCTILDSDHVGLLLKNVVNSRISGCLIRDDRQRLPSDGEQAKSMKTIRVEGGKGLLISNNLLSGPIEKNDSEIIDLANTISD
jgi:parallel beta-helix repeat protein